jgi:hypothetical protein
MFMIGVPFEDALRATICWCGQSDEKPTVLDAFKLSKPSDNSRISESRRVEQSLPYNRRD